MIVLTCMCCYFPQEYIHRVGRTARGEGGRGHALLILRPEELGFLRYLKQAKVPLNEFEFSWSKISNIQPQVSLVVISPMPCLSTTGGSRPLDISTFLWLLLSNVLLQYSLLSSHHHLLCLPLVFFWVAIQLL